MTPWKDLIRLFCPPVHTIRGPTTSAAVCGAARRGSTWSGRSTICRCSSSRTRRNTGTCSTWRPSMGAATRPSCSNLSRWCRSIYLFVSWDFFFCIKMQKCYNLGNLTWRSLLGMEILSCSDFFPLLFGYWVNLLLSFEVRCLFGVGALVKGAGGGARLVFILLTVVNRGWCDVGPISFWIVDVCLRWLGSELTAVWAF